VEGARLKGKPAGYGAVIDTKKELTMSNNEEVLIGTGYKAKVEFYTCKGSGECIKECS
jgi:hypothetical protein